MAASQVPATPASCRTTQTLGDDADPNAEERTIAESGEPGNHDHGTANIDVPPESDDLQKEKARDAWDDEFPDGGMRAWLVVLGVSCPFLAVLCVGTDVVWIAGMHRACVLRLARRFPDTFLSIYCDCVRLAYLYREPKDGTDSWFLFAGSGL
jgi:hypothetical protein